MNPLFTMGAAAALLVPVGGDTAVTPDADAPRVLVSSDGVAFTRGPVALFDGSRIVPGGAAEGTVWVRNSGPDAGYLTVVMPQPSIADPAVRGALTITASLGGAVPTASRVGADGACVVLSQGEHLDPGETVELVASVAMDDVSGQAHRAVDIDFTAKAVLSAAADAVGCPTEPAPPAERPGPTAAAPDPSPGHGSLAATGAEPGWLVALGLVVTGILLAVRSTRRRRATR